MTAYRFVLNCTPTAQARVRHAVRCGHSVAYKSAGQKSAEAVLDDLLSELAPEKPLDGPLALEFIAGMPIPVSTSKKDREAMLRGEIAHTKKPDLDNMAKQLKDAMSRAGFWGDDRQGGVPALLEMLRSSPALGGSRVHTGGSAMNERKLLLGWKAITAYTGVSRLLMIRYAYPVHDCDRATHHGYGVCAYTDELDAHKEATSA